jgi:two-component system nitrogen regulation response regulator GlnG/two-component system response regulator HydG
VVDESTLETLGRKSPAPADPQPRLALVLVWSAQHPDRVGEALVLAETARTYVFGRGGPRDEDPHPRLLLGRQRPGSWTRRPPLDDPFLSRVQLELRAGSEGIEVRALGKRSLLVDGEECEEGLVQEGRTVELRNRLMLLCVRRPVRFPEIHSYPMKRAGAFGAPDAHGIVGESAAAWAARERAAFVAGSPGHVLILGESGAGKELFARAIHDLSPRSSHKLVSRNASTFPGGIIDAELFGHAANYPNAGMPERAGLIAEADGGTLLLDEIGELPLPLQTHLLRVLDAGGEYQRLGETRKRTSDVRLLGATNRPAHHLREDLAARFVLRLPLPGLNERREDVPLLVHAMLGGMATTDRRLGERFFEGWDGATGHPRIAPELVRALVTHPYRTHARELARLLWTAVASSEGEVIEATPALQQELEAPAPVSRDPASLASGRSSTDVREEEIRASLARNGGVKERVWRELGLANRYVLKRLLKKYGIATEPDEG